MSMRTEDSHQIDAAAAEDEAGIDSAAEAGQPPNVDSGPGYEPPETFDRTYVERLRQESAEQRTKAKRSDLLAQKLVTAIAAKLGTLHDPSDLPYSDDLLDQDGIPDEQKITEAVTELANRKPHLVRIRPQGDVGQGSASGPPSSNLLDLIQGR